MRQMVREGKGRNFVQLRFFSRKNPGVLSIPDSLNRVTVADNI